VAEAWGQVEAEERLDAGGTAHGCLDAVYSLDTTALREVDAWLARFRRFWEHRLDALATEVARGKRARRKGG
jgi:hypothetical protein